MKRTEVLFLEMAIGFGLSAFFEVFIYKNLGVILMIFVSVCVMHDVFVDFREEDEKNEQKQGKKRTGRKMGNIA